MGVDPAEIARAMDCPVELLPYLPELVQGLDSLGADPARLLEILDKANVPRESRAIDLGCGKGAFGVALAKRGHSVTGIDAFEPFVESARALAQREGVSARCAFRSGDIRDAARYTNAFGLAALIAVGRPFGSLRDTIGSLRQMVTPGGWVLLEDSYLAAPRPVAGFEEYRPFDDTMDDVRSFGDQVVARERFEPSGPDPYEQELQHALNERACRLIERRPDLAAPIRTYLDQQERMAQIYERDLPSFIALLCRRS